MFIIDPEGVIRSIQINDDAVGRSVEETLRILKAFQWADSHVGECSVRLSVWLPVFLSVFLLVILFVCLFIYSFVFFTVYLLLDTFSSMTHLIDRKSVV